MNPYIAMVSYKDNKSKHKKIYVNGEKSRSLARVTNHSCIDNAALVKVEKSEKGKPQLWLKAKTNIPKGKEITINYGSELLKNIKENGGCKCVKCLNVTEMIKI